MFILYEEIQFINSRKVNSPSIPQFPFTTSMSHDHNYKVKKTSPFLLGGTLVFF